MFFLSLLIIACISFLPIVFWGYIFAYIDDRLANKKRFILGILAGVCSVVPLLGLEYLAKEFRFIDVFQQANVFSSPLSSGSFILSLGLLLGAFSLFPYLIKIISTGEGTFGVFMKNIFGFFLFTFLLVGVFSFLNTFFSYFPHWNLASEKISFGTSVFDSLKLVIFYYCIIGFIEEGSKHFQFLGGGIGHTKNYKELVLFSLFVALGFSFVENILYLKTIIDVHGWGGEMMRVYFFRSSFSLMLHVLCSSILSLLFAKAWIRNEGKVSFDFIRVFLLGILLSVGLHALFDIALSFGISFLVFVYFIGGYLFVSSIFYRSEG